MSGGTGKKRVLLCSFNFYTTIWSFIESLTNASIEVTLFAPSRAVRTYPLKKCTIASSDIPESDKEYLEKLEQFIRSNDEFNAYLYHDDMAMRILMSADSTLLREKFSPLRSADSSISLLTSKIEFSKKFADWNFPTPKSIAVDNIDRLDEAVEALGLPCIFKPDSSTAGYGVQVVRGKADLEKIRSEVPKFLPMVAQEFLPGCIGSMAALFDQGAPIAWISSYKVHVFPPPFGPSSARKVLQHPELEEVLAQFGKETGYNGFVGFDWIRCEKTDQIFFIELNGRPTPQIYCSRLMGVDFGVAYKKILEGKADEFDQPKFEAEGAAVPLFPQSLRRALGMGSLTAAGKLLLNPTFWKDVPLSQPRLTVALLRKTFSDVKRYRKGL